MFSIKANAESINKETENRIYPGKIVGRWKVTSDYIITSKKQKKWFCKCRCGTRRYVLEKSLLYSASFSCGCSRLENNKIAVPYELTGKCFGELFVLSRAEKQRKHGGIWWTCRCSCGNIIDHPATRLVHYQKTHCGCKTKINYYTVDISGKRFERLKALYPTDKRSKKGSVIWHCICDCGSKLDLSYNDLVYSNLKSCGCKKREHEQSLNKYLTQVAGTSIDVLKSDKIPINNTSGTKGVYFTRGKWIAKIVFQRKAYYLGTYKNYEDAVSARKKAEQLLCEKTIEHYALWKKRADLDHIWAEKNPIKIIVNKTPGHFITATFLPVITD